MPFTAAHPIVIAPLWRASKRWLDLPALVVGSMIPDLEYYVRLRAVGRFGHSLLGIVLLGVPSTIVIVVLIRFVIAKPFLESLPRSLSERIPDPTNQTVFRLQKLLMIVVSAFLGAVSHTVVDGFTHTGGWFVERLPVLSTNLRVAGRLLPLYQILQYGGSVVGLAAVAAWAAFSGYRSPRQYSRSVLPTKTKYLAWGWIASCAAVVTVVAVRASAYRSVAALVVSGTIGVTAGLAIGITLYALLYWGITKRADRSEN